MTNHVSDPVRLEDALRFTGWGARVSSGRMRAKL